MLVWVQEVQYVLDVIDQSTSRSDIWYKTPEHISFKNPHIAGQHHSSHMASSASSSYGTVSVFGHHSRNCGASLGPSVYICK